MNSFKGKNLITKQIRTGLGTCMIGTLIMLTGCTTDQIYSNGPQISEDQVALVPVGSSRDQVLLALPLYYRDF